MYVINCNTKAVHKITVCAYISQADFARIATYCCWFQSAVGGVSGA